MKVKKMGLLRRLTAVAAIASLSVLGLAGTAQADSNVGNIDTGKTGSIIVHKYDGAYGTDGGDGSVKTDTSNLGKPLDGAEFTVKQVTAKDGQTIDLKTPEGWDLISGLKASDVKGGGFSLGNGVSKTTANGGLATFGGLPLGLYLVEETKAPTNATSTTDPFLVTLPFAQSNGKWLYDVNVYPKNSVNNTEPTKEVSNPSAPVLGETVDWTITAPVPAANNGIKKFSIVDQLDPRLSFVSAKVAGFTAGTDYTIDEAGQKITINFTAAGIGKLETGQKVVATVTTKVTSQGDGTIENTALVNTNDSSVETPAVSTNWGSLQIIKHVAGDKARTLAGAEFDIFSDKDGQNKVASVTTAADGTVSITLWVGNNDVAEKKYWVKETKAPTGYILDESINEVTVKAGETAAAVKYEFANTQQGHPDLPLTGADGKLLAMIAGVGLMLIAGGAGIVAANRRKNQV
ncbi:SpaH/EbpB family LPXTG-anchored major pilin [Brevibacterium linens]|uniref:LPXTG-motif cell wall anchor domain-containing protein/fimbrial isopeptide formation D2 domain-containing protein n=1 Tax=Brevibacterium linens ATCC 9172 TaxID=1255617 RepID=A0A2H1JC29_BRELN|nr:SpaH/EbpB family LPXTG-anchored major pilin [Brevibacterium linens]KAB1948157.1 SpaH/EbpB family LPXTG-anchored major pilin [Brevibacterium linens ATCC 9172]SMX84904.1 LPXTG-motif cell wall anchor domain-containing protein/fimbrial isopeptide formation D2 domain-containing protein [Brevibacterium linens ATCC 9172]